jgi:hypothetical protein
LQGKSLNSPASSPAKVRTGFEPDRIHRIGSEKIDSFPQTLDYRHLTALIKAEARLIDALCPHGGMVDTTVFKTEVLCGACQFESGCGHHVATKGLIFMSKASDQMKMLETELNRVRADIEKLRAEEALLIKLIGQMNGVQISTKPPRQRSPSIKPVVLDIMRDASFEGASTAEVDERVRLRVPSVAKDTVGSVLSRLKSDGALIYVNERYYEKKFAPTDGDRTLRAVK